MIIVFEQDCAHCGYRYDAFGVDSFEDINKDVVKKFIDNEKDETHTVWEVYESDTLKVYTAVEDIEGESFKFIFEG